MTSKPLYNALLALAYIVGIVSLVVWAPRAFGAPEQSIFYPMLALALLVLSVAIMAYLFFYQPLTLLLDGHREKAIKFFLQTVGIFAMGTVAILLIAFFSSSL